MKKDKQPLAYAYELLKGSPVDPTSIYGDASGPATTNPKKEDEDEELMQKCKALALFRAQKKSQKIDPPFSMVQKEYEAVLREVFTSRAGNWSDEAGSSTIPHGPDETGTSTASKKPPTVGWTNQNQPTRSYRTTDPQVLPDSPMGGVGRGPGASRGPARRGSAQSGLYPEGTHITTVQTGRGQTPGDTFDMPYHDSPAGRGDGAQSGGYNTALGESQPLKKEKSQLGGYIAALYQENEFGRMVEGSMMLDELEKGARAGRPGGAQSYSEEDNLAAGGVARMDEETKQSILHESKKRDMTEAQKLEEIANRLEEEAAAEEPTDARLKPSTPSKKREMAQKARSQAAELMKRWNSGQYPSGPLVTKTTRHGPGF